MFAELATLWISKAPNAYWIVKTKSPTLSLMETTAHASKATTSISAISAKGTAHSSTTPTNKGSRVTVIPDIK